MKHIKDIAVGHEEKFVRTEFSEEQQAANKDQYLQSSIELAKLEEEFDLVKQIWKEKIEPVKRAAADALKTVRLGYTEEKKTVYLVPDFGSNMMEFYTEDGTLVESRRLLPNERQENFLRQIAIKGE